METSGDNQVLLNDTNNNEQKISNITEKIVLFYHFSWPIIIFLCIHSLCIIFFFFDFCLIAYKRVIIIDEKRKIIIICDKGILGICKLNQKTYEISQVKKVRIYVTSKPDPKKGFSKLYYINCDIFSNNGEQESLFGPIDYTEEKFNKFSKFLEKHLNTEVVPKEVEVEPLISEEENITPSEGNDKITNDGKASLP